MMIPELDCSLCSLCIGRKNIVRPDGDLTSRVVFVGEAPGENEDDTGRPFVGRSGKLLDRIMFEEGICRSKVMITNTVKCRPPGNRDPTKEEMKACRPFLESELSGCDLVIGLGKSACRDLLGYSGKMADVVNKRFEIDVAGKKIPFIPTYHPAACIYNRDFVAELKRTMRMIKQEYARE